MKLKNKEWFGITNELSKIVKTYFRKYLTKEFADISIDTIVTSGQNKTKLILTVNIVPAEKEPELIDAWTTSRILNRLYKQLYSNV